MKIQRRQVIKSALALSLGCFSSNLTMEFSALADEPPKKAPDGTAPHLPITEQLMYATVRLEMPELGGRTGTGFFFSFFRDGLRNIPAIITNHHVIAGAQTINFRMIKASSENTPLIGETISFKVGDLDKRIVTHPEADLSAILIGDVFGQAIEQGQKPYYIQLDRDIIIKQADLNNLSPLEPVVTVGYPGQLWDDVNNLPIFHKGYTASAAYIPFKGKREFLLDFATWPGASGSPVFLYNDGVIFDQKSNNINFGARLGLIGVVYGVAVQEVTGAVVIAKAPVGFDPTNMISASNVPTNLGVCLRASRVAELEQHLFKIGVTVPSGYSFWNDP